MAMVINVNTSKKCATCQYMDDSCVKDYDPKTGRMTVDNSGSYCGYNKRKMLASANACTNYKRSYMY